MHPVAREGAQALFLAGFRSRWTVTAGCQLAGVSRQTVYRWIHSDPAFGARYREAEAEVCDQICDELRRRGVEGWLEPVFWAGKPVLDDAGEPVMVRRYSDRCLKLLAQIRLPEYRRQ